MITKRAWTAVFLCLLMFGGGIFGGFFVSKMMQGETKTVKPVPNVTLAKTDNESAATHPEVFVIKIDNDKVAVYKHDAAGVPVFQYYCMQINMYSLRTQDRQRLREGITAQGSDELASIIEDLCS